MTDFIKAHGLGNDMIMFENMDVSLLQDKVAWLCDRKYGVGADGVVSYNDGEVRFWNADGSSAKMCGNACRCLIKYIYTGEAPVRFHTPSGEVTGWVEGNQIIMRYPCKPQITETNGYYFVNVGNQHVIIFADNDDIYDHRDNVDFKNYNVMFLKKTSSGWFMKIHEAGVGETNACGSGAVAASVAIWHREKNSEPVQINMRGGTLTMSIEKDDIYQSGAAQIVFKGSIDLG